MFIGSIVIYLNSTVRRELMVTFKKFKYVIFSLLAIAVIASATAFSVSYAKWVSPANDSLGANLSTGEWDKPNVSGNHIIVGDRSYDMTEMEGESGTFITEIYLNYGDTFQVYYNSNLVGYPVTNIIELEYDAQTKTYKYVGTASARVEVTLFGSGCNFTIIR